MSIQEVCRLCLSKDNLVWVFDKRLERTDHMKDVIFITTGVEIHSKDVISQKICTKCGQDALKMFQFRQQSLKNDRYLKAQCRDLLKHTDLKIPNTDVTIKTERIDKEEIKEEPRRAPPYRVHPTMRSLSRKYPQMQFPSICLLSNVDPCISMEMDIVENYFKSRKLNMRKYVQLALRTSDKNIPKKSAEAVHKVSPINIKLNESGYTIVRPSTEQLATDSPETQSCISESKKRRLSDNNSVSEPSTKKVLNANPNTTPVQPSVEKKSPPPLECNICRAVLFSAKHLKKHQARHKRCKFCKLQFKSVGMKRQHIIHSCLVKEALTTVSNIELERVELNRNIRLHYQDAFTTFPPLRGMEKLDSTSTSTKAAEEVIEIISDEEGTSICPRNSAPATSTVTTSFLKNPTSSTAIRPDVRIKNDNLLDSIKTQASELEILKELLTKLEELRSVSEITQTELPMTELIQVNDEKLTAELKNLKQVLHLYRIPVFVRSGSSMNVSYNHQYIPARHKKLSLWNDLTPIDLETENGSISNENPSSEHVTTETPATHANGITNNVDSVHKGESCNSFSNDQPFLQNMGNVIPANLPRSVSSSDSTLTQSGTAISTHAESVIPTPGYCTVQAECATSSPQSSFHRNGQNRIILPDFPQSSTSLEIFPVPTASSVGDIAIGRHSPKSFGTTPHTNSHALEIHPVQVTPRFADSFIRRNSPGVDQTTLQSSAHINSEPQRMSPVLNKSDVNGNVNSIITLSEAIDCSLLTRQDLTNKAIEYIFKNGSEFVDTGKTNVRPSNGIIYSNNNQQYRARISYKEPKLHPDFSKGIANYHKINLTNSTIGSHKLHGNNAPMQRMVLNDNNVFLKPPPPYPNRTPVNGTTQSYISSHTNSSTVPHADKTLQTSGYYNAYNQYVTQRQELSSATVRGAIFDSVAHRGKTGYFPASNLLRNSVENRPIPRYPRISGSFPHYAKTNNYVNATSDIVNPVNQNCDVNNGQLPNTTCRNSSTPAACDNLTDSLPSTDKSKHIASGLIRVKNVCELT